MNALVIYDATGMILSIIYGAEQVPQGVPCMWVDIPDGAQLDRIDVSDPENPQPIFLELDKTDIQKLQLEVNNLKNDLTDTQMALTEQYEQNLALQEEVTSTQLALCEIYEGMGV